MERVKFNTTLDKTLITNLKIYAIKKNIDVNEILDKLIEDFLEREQDKQEL